MNPQDFRQHAHQIVDWIADYYSEFENYPVTPQFQPGDLLQQLPAEMPVEPEAFEQLFLDFQQQILPGMTHWQHPGFFAYFPANASPPSLLAEMLTSALGAQCMSWLTSPAATELEQRVMEWLRAGMQLPADWQGVIQDTASTATLCALLSARERASGFAINQRGFQGERYRIYASSEAHSSVEKAVRMAGFGSENLVKVPVDADFALVPEALTAAIAADREAGFQPLAVVAAWGTTGSTALDPLQAMGEICQREQLWYHIDAAYAGSALILPEQRASAQGLELADSLVFNPHKWLFTHFDCSAYFVKDAQTLEQTFGLTPEYLKTSLDRQVHNYRDWGIQLGRRFRALKLWFVLRSYGLSGLQQRLREQISWVQELSQQIDTHPDFERLAPVPLNLVCFRWNPAQPPGSLPPDEAWLDRCNETLLQTLNASGKLFITHTKLKGRYALRLVAGQLNTQHEHVQQAWQQIQQTASELAEVQQG